MKSTNKEIKNKSLGTIWGLFVGDAKGAPYEFLERDSYKVVEGYGEGGCHQVEKGEYTDDSSMALCLIDSINRKEGNIDFHHIMKTFNKWRNKSYLGTRDYCFDIGNQTKNSLRLYEGNPIKDDKSLVSLFSNNRRSGNGGIMRQSPMDVFNLHLDINDAIKISQQYSALTHSSQLCISSAKLLTILLRQLILGNNDDKLKILLHIQSMTNDNTIISIINNAINLKLDNIQTSGFVIHTIESAIKCWLLTNTFEEGLNLIVSLGDDTDTTGAVYGQIAGAYYGFDKIPKYYIENLMNTKKNNKMVNDFLSFSKLIN